MNIEYVCPWEVEVKWHKPDGVTRVIHASGKTREDAFDQVRLIMDTPSISFDEAARRAMNKTTELTAIRDALLKCGITGDSLFARIREDIDRGLIREARSHLNFVDRINAAHRCG